MTKTLTFEDVIEETGYLYWKTVGASMRPLIKEGRDTVLIKKRTSAPLKRYDAVLFKRPGVVGRGAYILHRILKINNDGTYWIVGDNCRSGEIVTDDNIIGVLDTVVRKGKRIKTTNFLYKIYVHVWCDFYPIRFLIIRCYTLARSILLRIYRRLKRIKKRG